MQETLTRVWVRAVVPLEAASFFVGALLHTGVGFAGLDEPRIIPAAVVESICGLGLAFSTYSVFSSRPWWRRATLISQILALGGVMLGQIALAAGRGPRTQLNDTYHSIMTILLLVGLALLLIARPRAPQPEEREPAHRQQPTDGSA